MRGLLMMENDYEVIYLAQENDETAIEYIIKKYKFIIDIIIKKYKVKIISLKVDKDDIYNVGLFAIHKAIDLYNADCASFASFVSVLINRYVNNFLKLNDRKKDSIYINSCFLNESIADEKLLEEMKNSNPYFLIVEQENYQELYDKIVTCLTDLEKAVFSLFMDFTPQDIANILGIERKTVYNAIGRIRNKTQKLIANKEKI